MAVAVEGSGGDGVEEEEEPKKDENDTDTRPKVDKGKAVMTGPWPDDDEGPRDYFLGPLNSNPPVVLSATLHDKRGSGWWSSDFLPPLNSSSSSSNGNNPRHASLQFLPSRQAAHNMHRQSLPVEALRVASRGSAL